MKFSIVWCQNEITYKIHILQAPSITGAGQAITLILSRHAQCPNEILARVETSSLPDTENR